MSQVQFINWKFWHELYICLCERIRLLDCFFLLKLLDGMYYGFFPWWHIYVIMVDPDHLFCPLLFCCTPIGSILVIKCGLLSSRDSNLSWPCYDESALSVTLPCWLVDFYLQNGFITGSMKNLFKRVTWQCITSAVIHYLK